MSAKPCRGCGKLVVFAKDPDGKWQVLDVSVPTWEQIKSKDGVAQVRRSQAMASHFSACPYASSFSRANRPAEQPVQRDFNEPKEIQ